VVARALDEWWREQGSPDPFVVVDAGAGPGTLARSVLAARPECGAALRYVLVERASAQRTRHARHLPLEPPDEAFPGAVHEDDAPSPPSIGPIAVSLAELPEQAVLGVVVANELLDNLAFALCERSADGWREVWVSVEEGALAELLVPARPTVGEIAGELAPEAELGARVPVALGAMAWLSDVLDRLGSGRLVVFDYMSASHELAARDWTEWLRTYAGHQRGVGPLERPGRQDITVQVPLDQLARVRAPASVTSQASFLALHGLEELVDEGRRLWNERAGTGDLAAMRARSRIREAEALTDPHGLGAFTVAQWVLGR
jgi:SAM-dependent MidA family methyltransferase